MVPLYIFITLLMDIGDQTVFKHNNDDSLTDMSSLSIPPDTTEIDLEKNAINGLQSDAFPNLGNVLEMTLHSNSLGTNGIHKDALQSLSALTTLKLSNNELSSLHYLTFQNVTSITDLVVGSNLLSDFQEGTLNYLINLEDLNIRNSLFTQIKRHYFSGLTKLRFLKMKNNQIQNIEQDSFADNHILELIEIYENQLQTWSYDTFGASTFYLNKVLRIELAINPMHCDCGINWLKVKEESGIILFDDNSYPECSTPQEMNGLSWSQVKQQLTCDCMCFSSIHVLVLECSHCIIFRVMMYLVLVYHTSIQ